jgi:hypothetical protein
VQHAFPDLSFLISLIQDKKVKAIAVNISPSVLARADEVIE